MVAISATASFMTSLESPVRWCSGNLSRRKAPVAALATISANAIPASSMGFTKNLESWAWTPPRAPAASLACREESAIDRLQQGRQQVDRHLHGGDEQEDVGI